MLSYQENPGRTLHMGDFPLGSLPNQHRSKVPLALCAPPLGLAKKKKPKQKTCTVIMCFYGGLPNLANKNNDNNNDRMPS